MALQITDSRLEHKYERTLASGIAVPLERGMIMEEIDQNGVQVLQPCAGAAATERIAGVLWLSETDQAAVPVRETVVVPAAPGPYTVALANTPLASSERLVRLDTGAALATPADYSIAGNIITFNAALAGVAVQVDYRHNITAQELARRGGRRSVNQGAEGLYSSCTLATGQCRALVSNFDTAEAYAIGDPILSAPNGTCSSAGAGTTFGEVFQVPSMLSSPGIEQLFLGVSFNLPLAP